MNQNSEAIVTLCSHLCEGEGVVPLEPKEWGDLAKKMMEQGLHPKCVFELSSRQLAEKLELSLKYAERIERLVDRAASLTFELIEYEKMGITVVTRADESYPSRLKKKLGNNCPPLFYCAGDMSLLDGAYIGYVGSRTVSEDDETFTRNTVLKTVKYGYGVVSGGAKGIDTIAEEAALQAGAPVVEFLSDSMMRKIKKSDVVRAVREGNLLLLSVVKPDAAFNVGTAMMRNRYIYAQSCGTVVVRSEYNKGGTWAGATENLKHEWCMELCRDKKSYPGNKALIERGAIPISESWSGDISSVEAPKPTGKSEQLSMFDI